jgi:hypothetical protein
MERTITLLLILLVGGLQLRAQVSLTGEEGKQFDQVRTLWTRHLYEEAFQAGRKLRTAFNKRTEAYTTGDVEFGIPELDYMIFSSMCKLPDRHRKGCDLFQYIYQSHLEPTVVKQLTVAQHQLCDQPNAYNPESLLLIALLNIPRAHVSGSFKTFDYVFGYESNLPSFNVISFPAPIVLDTSKFDAYRAQRIALDDPDKDAKIDRLMGLSGFSRKYGSKHFIFLAGSFGFQDSTIVKKIAEEMERVLAFYYQSFNFLESPYYIVVYLNRDDWGIGSLIDRVYGLHQAFTSNPIGYSNALNNAIFTRLSPDLKPGTIKHELMHLLLPSSFGNVPGWFEEGLASLYEQSRFEGQSLSGEPNWRGKFLKDQHQVPTLERLFTDTVHEEYISDQELEDAMRGNKKVQREITARTINRLRKDATSRYFFLYIQQKVGVTAFYNAYKYREDHMLDDDYTPTPDSLLVPAALGFENMTKLQEAFDQWLLTAN